MVPLDWKHLTVSFLREAESTVGGAAGAAPPATIDRRILRSFAVPAHDGPGGSPPAG